MFAHQQNYISPDNFQFFSSVFFLLAVLFGGAGTLMGPVIGAAVLTLLPEMLHDFDKFRLIVYGTLHPAHAVFPAERRHGPVRARRPAVPARGAGRRDRTAAQPLAGLPDLAGAGAALELDARVASASAACRRCARSASASRPGTIHALIGPNGAGKTTLINIITGFYRADAGAHPRSTASPLAIRSMDDAARHGIVRTFQTIKLFGDMTVLEHVMVGFARHSRSRHLVRACAGAGARQRRRAQPSRGARADRASSASTATRIGPANALALRASSPARDRPRAGGAARASCCSTSRPPVSSPRRSQALAAVIRRLQGDGHDRAADRAPHGPRGQHLRPRDRARLRRRHRRRPPAASSATSGSSRPISASHAAA